MAEISKQALIVENNQSFPNNNNGAITPSALREFNRDMIDSTVNQTVFNNYSSSVTQSLQSLAQFTASVAGTNAFTQSANIRITNLETWSSSLDVNYASQAEFNSYTQSNDAKVNSLIAFTSSVLNISALIPLNNFTASVAGTNAFTQSIQTEVNGIEAKTGSFATTGSNNFVGNQNINGSASITGSLVVTGEITANKLNVIIESSSVIFSSGSNILGDAVNDTQTLIGSTIMSGSASLSGSMNITNNLSVTNNISSSTISGIGNVTLYSTSVDSRLDLVEATASYLNTTFSTSVDARLDVVEATASLYVPFSTSVDSRLDYLETTFSTSVDARLDVVEATASLYVPFSTSVDSRLDLVESTSSYLNTTFSTSVDSRLDTIEAKYATTGSNTFIGSQTISGSVYGNVNNITIASQTASLNFNLGNLFQLTLVSGSTTRLETANIKAGQTINLLVSQPLVGYGDLVYGGTFKFTSGNSYVPTQVAAAKDIVTLLTFADTTAIYGASVKNLV